MSYVRLRGIDNITCHRPQHVRTSVGFLLSTNTALNVLADMEKRNHDLPLRSGQVVCQTRWALRIDFFALHLDSYINCRAVPSAPCLTSLAS